MHAVLRLVSLRNKSSEARTHCPIIWLLHFACIKQDRLRMLTVDLHLVWCFKYISNQPPEWISLIQQHQVQFSCVTRQENIEEETLQVKGYPVDPYMVISLLKIKSTRSICSSCSKTKAHRSRACLYYLWASAGFIESHLKLREIHVSMMMVNLPHQLIRCLVEKIYSLFKLSLSNYTGAFKFVWITGNKLHIIFSQYIKWKLTNWGRWRRYSGQVMNTLAHDRSTIHSFRHMYCDWNHREAQCQCRKLQERWD